MGRVVLLLLLFVLVSVMEGGQPFKPPHVKQGDTVGFISPASPIYYAFNSSTYAEHVQKSMEPLGLSVKFSKNAFKEYGYLAGTDKERASDIMDMFRDPSVSFIIANRGGWGCNRIIDTIDYDVIKQNPKPIMGYSDLTGLLNAIYTKTGLVTFHGPMGLDTWWGGDASFNGQYVKQSIMTGQALFYQNLPAYRDQLYTITPGTARGRLIGGNLSVFVAMIGSEYLLKQNLQNAILFLEDVGEAPYRIDRMLTQLHLAGFFDEIAGFVFGICSGCTADNKNQSLSIPQILDEKIRPLGVPAYAGAMFGHELDAQFTLPIGIEVAIDASAGTITMLESAVQ